jgi:uncharacterized membrane protein
MRFVLIFIPIIIASIGQIILKSGMNQVGKFNLIKVFLNPLVLLGLFFYASSSVLWLMVLSKEKLSFVYPLVAASYVLTILMAKIILKEPVPTLRWLGLGIIIIGIMVVAKS